MDMVRQRCGCSKTGVDFVHQRCEYGSTKVVVGQSVNMVGQTCGCGETLVQTWWDKAVKRKCKLYFRFTSYLASRNKLLPILKSCAGEGTHYLYSSVCLPWSEC